jgi:hypothetical protein
MLLAGCFDVSNDEHSKVPVKSGPATPDTENKGTNTPSTEIPKTETPNTQTPDTETPDTETPDTEIPPTEIPATEIPATETPATETPATEIPDTETPATETPDTETPDTEIPATEIPATETPATETPATETPDTETPDTETPDTETPDAVIARSTVLPIISEIPEQFVKHMEGENLMITPVVINQSSLDGIIHWTKNYGPDDIAVHSETGNVTWAIDDDMPSESFHIGLKASTLNDSVNLSFIVHAGVEQVITAGPGGDYESISGALENLRPGGTLILLDGDFKGALNFIGQNGGHMQHPPSGNEFAFTTVMAKHPGQSILSEGALVRLNSNDPVSYAAFKGLYLIGGQLAVSGYKEFGEEGNRRHHHIKFIRNGVVGGDKYEQPFSASKSDYILFENNYALGGGRYKFASWHATNIVWRRNVARYDRGLVYNKPKGTYSVYSSTDAFLGNNIAIDADSPDFVNTGELAGEYTTPTTSGDTRARFQRNIQLNSAFLFTNVNHQSGGDSDVEFLDTISWDVRPANRYIMTWGTGWFDHMTLGDIRPRQTAAQFFNSYHDRSRGITNSILHNFKNGDMFYNFKKEIGHITVDNKVVERYGVDTVNISEFEGSLIVRKTDIENMTELNPIQSTENPNGSMRYLTRIEPNTNLSGLAKDGGDIGATVMTFVGKSGTFYGEAGYDSETNIPMWPFPMESLIKDKFSQYSYTGMTYTGHYVNRIEDEIRSIVGARGFAIEGQSLTDYIWGYLGNVVPPFNVSASPDGESVLLQWSTNTAINQRKIIAYNIYSYDLISHEKIFILQVSKDARSYKVDNLLHNTKYNFIVTAVTDTSESGFSYPVEATIQ